MAEGLEGCCFGASRFQGLDRWGSGFQEAFYGDISTLSGFFIRGFIWDIPILIFAYVLFWGPSLGQAG